MAQVNPWVEIYYSPTGTRSYNHEWVPNKEYCIQVHEKDKDDEVGHSFIKIPPDMDLQKPTTGTIGWRVSGGIDHLVVAEITTTGLKRFRLERSQGNSTIVRISERDLVPDSSLLDPADNTAEFELWYTTQGRALTIPNFDVDYEYLFVIQCDQSSSERYYSGTSFYNFSSPYTLSSHIHSRMIHYWGLGGWDDWFRLTGKTVTATYPTTKFKGPGQHKMYRIYRRPMNYDINKNFYNTFKSVSKGSQPLDRISVSKASMPMNEEYMFATLDTKGDNELCMQGQMVLTEKLMSLFTPNAGFAHQAGTDHWMEVIGTPSSYYWTVDSRSGRWLEIFRKVTVEEYVAPPDEPDPEPLPPPPEPDPIIPCEDRCLNEGDTFVSEVKVEVRFVDPPDWQLRRYKYEWKSKHKELSLKGVEQNGRIGIFKLTRTVTEADSNQLIPYTVSVTVSDLDYATAGVSDADEAVLSFEMPCVVVNNETEFSVNDINVAECGASDNDTTATFTITSSEAVIGDSRTVEYSTTGITATSGSDFTAATGTVTFDEGDTSKQVDIVIKCDDVPEKDETFKLVISNPSIGTIGKSEGIATIVDDSPDVTVVELASEGESYQVYIYRDISGSMLGQNMNLNGDISATRDNIAVQILNDFLIPSANVVGSAGASVTFFTSYVRWVLDNLPANQKKVSILFVTDAEDGYGSGAPNLIGYSSASDNHPPVESHGNVTGNQYAATPEATAVVAQEGSTWSSTIGTVPAHIEEMKITVVRLLPQSSIDAAEDSRNSGNPNNTAVAEDGFNGILTTAPSIVTQASFETFSSYTTGEDSVLNDRISEAVLNTYTAYCAKSPDDTISVQAADETEAKSKAKPLLNCPDD